MEITEQHNNWCSSQSFNGFWCIKN